MESVTGYVACRLISAFGPNQKQKRGYNLKIRSLMSVSILALAVVMVSAPVKAQDSKVSLFGGYSFGTNNFNCNSNFGCEDPGLHGYALAATYNFNKNIGLEAAFSGHNGSPTIFFNQPTSGETGDKGVAGQDIYTYTFGPKLTLPVGNFSLFTHVLVGGSHVHIAETDTCVPSTGTGGDCSGSTPGFAGGSGSGMAVKVGGGVDWNHGRWGIRILEANYVHSQLFANITNCTGCTPFGVDTSWNGFEMSTGVIFNFGKK
jgi:hypothetical protein